MPTQARAEHAPAPTTLNATTEVELQPFDAPGASAANVTELEDGFRPVTQKQQISVLVCASLAVFLTVGMNQTYGVFQGYYTSAAQTMLPAAEAQNGALIAFVGTLGSGLTWGGSIYVNPLLAHAPRRPWAVMLAGAALMALGLLLASLAQHTWQLLLTQGLLYGVGSAAVYFPPVGVAPEYFDARRGAAMGVVLSAAGIGGLVLAPATRALLSAAGPRTTLRALALLTAALGLPLAALCPGSRSARARPTLVNTAVARRPAFACVMLGAFLQSGGYYVPLTYLATFSASVGYSPGAAAALLGLSNGVNAVARVGMGFAADRLGRQNTLVFCCVGSALSVVVLWMAAVAGAARAVWVVFIVAYGVLSGGYHALLPTTIAEVFGVHTYPSINGLLYFVRGCGVLFGAPVGGVILGGGAPPRARFRPLVWYDGGLLLACAACVAGVRVLQARERGAGGWKWKA